MTCLTVGSAGTWILFSRSDSGLWGGGRQDSPLGQGLLRVLLSAPLLGPGAHFLPAATWLEVTGVVSGWMSVGLQLAGGRGPEGREDEGELGSRAWSPSSVCPGPWGSSPGGIREAGVGALWLCGCRTENRWGGGEPPRSLGKAGTVSETRA